MNTLGLVLPAGCYMLLNTLQPCVVGDDLFHSPCDDFYKASALLTAGVSLGGFAFSGYWVNFADISPRYRYYLYLKPTPIYI